MGTPDERFLPGDKVIVADLAKDGREVVAEVDGTYGYADRHGNASGPYRVWVIMPDRTVRVYDKHEVRHVDTGPPTCPPFREDS